MYSAKVCSFVPSPHMWIGCWLVFFTSRWKYIISIMTLQNFQDSLSTCSCIGDTSGSSYYQSTSFKIFFFFFIFGTLFFVPFSNFITAQYSTWLHGKVWPSHQSSWEPLTALCRGPPPLRLLLQLPSSPTPLFPSLPFPLGAGF